MSLIHEIWTILGSTADCRVQEYEFYYLQSRYYDPEVGRFLNADVYPSTGQGLLGNNMFTYCQNNPVMLLDLSGEFPWITVASAVVSGLVNLGTSALSAKITGQSFGFWDGVIAFGVGAACAFGSTGIGIGAAVNGIYTAHSNYANGASGWAPVVSGLAVTAITILGLGNYTELVKSWTNVGIQAFFDLVFVSGANLISSSINLWSIQNTGKDAVVTIDDASCLRYDHRVIGPNVYTIVQ